MMAFFMRARLIHFFQIEDSKTDQHQRVMSFWRSSSFAGPTMWHALKSKFSTRPPERLEAVAGPAFTGQAAQAEVADYAGVINFWQEHFKEEGGPRTSYTFADLVHLNKTLLIVRAPGPDPYIIGTIMARPLGSWIRGKTVNSSNFSTSYIDMFCVHSGWRGRGIGSSLLFAVFVALGTHSPSVFLKEGAPLSWALPPIRSSAFTFRYVMPGITTDSVIQWTPDQLRHHVSENSQYITNSLNNTESQIFATAGEDPFVAVFSPAHQIHRDGRPLVWMTGFVPSTSECSAKMRALSAAASKHFNSPWIWADAEAAPPDDMWKYDGPYHLYAFNWNPGVFFNGRALLLL